MDGDDGGLTLDAGVVQLLGLAVVLAGFFVAYVTMGGGASSGDLSGQVLQLALGLALPAGLAVAAIWLGRRRMTAAERWRVAMWAHGGLSALTVLTAYKFYVDTATGTLPPDAIETLLLNAAAGAVGGVGVGVYDVAAQRSAERAATARDELRFVNNLLRNNLLTSVRHMGQLAEEAESNGVDEDAFARTVRRQSAAIEGLVEKTRALEFAAGTPAELEAVDLVSVVEDLAGDLREREPDATVETSVPETAHVRADGLVEALVENLLNNAVDHHDRPAPTVEVGVDVEDDTVVMTVTDDGPGISARMKETAFEPDQGGSPGGIGLYVVDRLAERYGGSVDIMDAEPRGTSVVVRFRRATDDPAGVMS